MSLQEFRSKQMTPDTTRSNTWQGLAPVIGLSVNFLWPRSFSRFSATRWQVLAVTTTISLREQRSCWKFGLTAMWKIMTSTLEPLKGKVLHFLSFIILQYLWRTNRTFVFSQWWLDMIISHKYCTIHQLASIFTIRGVGGGGDGLATVQQKRHLLG